MPVSRGDERSSVASRYDVESLDAVRPFSALCRLDAVDDEQTVRSLIRDFLITRRARIDPDAAGLPSAGLTRRRVDGLRREEVAVLAGISVEYYTRLERGHAAGVSPGIVDAVAAALRLDDTERSHLHRLLRALEPGRRAQPVPTSRTTVRRGVHRLLEAFTDLPAFAFNNRLDILAANDLGRSLYSPVFDDPVRPPNSARFTFLHEARAREFWPEWHTFADHAVAVLHTEVGRHPHDPALIELIGQLSARSHQFRARWATHDVLQHTSGTKILRHPLVGTLALPYENILLAGESEIHVMVYTPERGSPQHDALALLASWDAHAQGDDSRHSAIEARRDQDGSAR